MQPEGAIHQCESLPVRDFRNAVDCVVRCDTTRARRRCFAGRASQRRGAVFSIEMMMLISVLIPMMFALTEFSLFWSARHLLNAAASQPARAAAMPAPTNADRCDAAMEAADSVLIKPRFRDPEIGYTMTCDAGMYHGDMVMIEIEMPMTTASPDLLGIIGISIEDKVLTAQAAAARQN